MNTAKRLGFFSSLKQLILCCAGIYFGYWLMDSGDQGFYWIGYALACFGSLAAITSLFGLAISSKDSAVQLTLETQARRPSGMHGRSKLADTNDPIIIALSKGKGLLVGVLKGTLLFFDPFAAGMGHMISIGATRAGKTICLVIPALLYWFEGSVLVTDTKGELYKITARFRKFMKQEVVKWDGFGVSGEKGVSINPLQLLRDDVLKNEGKKLKELATSTAYVLLPKDPDDKQPFFARGGRRLLIAFMCYLAVIEKSKCHLPGLRELIWSSLERKKQIVTVMKSCPNYGGLLQGYANILEQQLAPEYFRTFGPMLENAMNATDKFEAHTDFGKSLMENEYDLECFLQKRTTLYIILSEDSSEEYGIVAGLIINSLIKKIGSKPKGLPILMLLEEAGNIGVIHKLDTILSLLTSKNVRVWMIFQSKMQLVLNYGSKIAKIALDQCSFKQYLDVSEEDAETISKRSGKKTIKIHQHSNDPQNKDAPWKLSVSEKGENVLTPDQILISEDESQIIDIKKKPLIKSGFVRYFEIDRFRKYADPHPYHDGYPSDKPVKYILGDK